MHRRRRTMRAAVLLQVAMLMTVLLGFAALTTDYGLLLLRQRALQNGVDAAALAAGPELGDRATGSVATQHVYDYAAANRIPVSSVVINNRPTDLPRTITVTSKDAVSTVFARVLNPRNRSEQVSASATVAAYPVTQAWRLRPWGVPYAFFNARGTGLVHYGEPATLAITSVGNENPNDLGQNQTFIDPLVFGAADSPEGPYSNYIRNCSEGFSQGVSLTNRAQTAVLGQPGSLDSIVAATAQALKGGSNSIMSQAGATAYQNNSWDNPGESPRVVILPVIDQVTGGEANILAFTAFYIENMDGNLIKGRFIPYTLPFDGTNPRRLDSTSYNYGVYTFHLTK